MYEKHNNHSRKAISYANFIVTFTVPELIVSNNHRNIVVTIFIVLCNPMYISRILKVKQSEIN